MEDWQNGGFGIYLHWPFCASKCPYCDFNSHVVASVDQSAWRDAYLSELRRVASDTGGRILNSVFFGGGTYDFERQAQAGRLADTGLLRRHPPWAGRVEQGKVLRLTALVHGLLRAWRCA